MFLISRPSFDRIQGTLQWLWNKPERGDSIVDARIEGLVALLHEQPTAPGGWLDRGGFFGTVSIEGSSKLIAHPAGLPGLVTRVKTVIRVLTEKRLWENRQDIEAQMPSQEPLAERLRGQTYRMMLWVQAVVSSQESTFIDLLLEKFRAFAEVLFLRQQLTHSGHVEHACRQLIGKIWTEPQAIRIAGVFPDPILQKWIGQNESIQNSQSFLKIFKSIAELPGYVRLPIFIECLTKGSKGVFSWAKSRVSSERLLRPLEGLACRLLLDLLMDAFQRKQWQEKGAPIFHEIWIRRILETCDDEGRALLAQLVSKATPQQWRSFVGEADAQNPVEIQKALTEIFPLQTEILGDQVISIIEQWQQEIMTLEIGETLESSLELFFWLGVTEKHAAAVRHQALEIIHYLFREDERYSESELLEMRIKKWTFLASIARFWPESLVLEALQDVGGGKKHLEAIVSSGHPRFAARLFEAMQEPPESLSEDLRQFVDFRIGAERPVKWRWWAFLVAMHPGKMEIDPSKGVYRWQMTTLLSHITQLALRGGVWREEIEVVITALLNHGANPWHGAASAWGSPFEQLYYVDLQRTVHKNHPQILVVATKLKEILRQAPWREPIDASGRISVTRRSPLLQK